MQTKIIQNIKSIVFALILVFCIGVVSADWSNPPAGTVPPNNNTEAPVNVGSASQIKTGPLTLGGLGIVGDLKFLPVSGTPPTTGQVLMADDSDLSHGKVKWGTGAGGGGGNTYTTVTNPSSYTADCPSGSTMVSGGCWCVDGSNSNDSSAYGGRPTSNGWECMSTTGAGCSGGITSYARCVSAN